MDLLSSFKDFTAAEHLFAAKDKLLLAVSGGIDSVVLCECCHQARLDFVIAHANFQLRGDESLRDENFVRQLAEKYNRELLVRRFDTRSYAATHRLSIQVAARELRYSWFRELTGQSDSPITGLSSSPITGQPASPYIDPASDPTIAPALQPDTAPALQPDTAPASGPTAGTGPRWIVTAHHLDDNIETLLMNFFKGTGIAGLRAILPRQGNIVRPLLFAHKDDLKKFAQAQQLSWVEDSSNDSDKYTRNYFRHQVIPLVQQLYPPALDNLADNIPRFREIEMLYRQSVQQHKKKLLKVKGEETHIPVLQLKKSVPLPTLVYEIIAGFGFSPQQVEGVIGLLESESGKYIRSSTHRILKDRKWLIISAYPTIPSSMILIESPEDKVVYENGTLKLALLPVHNPAILIPEPSFSDLASPASVVHPDVPASKPGPSSSSSRSQTSADLKISADPLLAQLDAKEIRFPLLLRKWRTGDYFYPLGMGKKKKLGRFFIDQKLSLAAKEKVWVIEMNKKIIWVVGLRIDHRFRITPQTRQILKIESGMS